MGIQIVLSSPIIMTYSEKALEKIRVCYEAVKQFQGNLFSVREIQIWYDATSQSLGGIQVRTIQAENLYGSYLELQDYINNLSLDNLRRTIIVFAGKWDFETIAVNGYFSVLNQEDWQKTYGDILISAYAKRDIEDLVDGFWSLPEVKEIIVHFVQNLVQSANTPTLRLSQISFSSGVYSNSKPTNLMALYLSGTRRRLLSIFYKALISMGEKSIVLKSRPIDAKFLLDILLSNSIVTERINKRLERDLVTEIPTASVLYFGKERDSFKKLFDEIATAVFVPAFSKLPEQSLVEYQINTGIEDYKDEEK